MDKNPYLPGSPDEFIEKNLGLAQSLAWKYFKSSKDKDIDDITSIAYYGLVKAYEGFDPTGKTGQDGGEVKFSTYAASMIKGYIMSYYRQTDRPINISRRYIDLISKVNRSDLQGNETPEEIAEIAGITLEEVHEALMASVAKNVDSLDREINVDDSNCVLGDIIGKCDEINEDEEILKEFREQLKPKRLREVYDLCIKGEMPQIEAAKILGLSQSYVSRIETKIIDMARRFGHRKEGKEMKAKYPDELKGRIKELSSTKTAAEIFEIVKTEFPAINIPLTTVATMVSQYRKLEGEVVQRMVTQEEADRYGIKTSADEIDWFVDISTPTIASIGITKAGITFNSASIQEMGLKAGELARIGLGPEGKLYISKHTQGLLVRKKNDNGATITSKSLIGWLKRKGIKNKRYPLKLDALSQMYYVEVVD